MVVKADRDAHILCVWEGNLSIQPPLELSRCFHWISLFRSLLLSPGYILYLQFVPLSLSSRTGGPPVYLHIWRFWLAVNTQRGRERASAHRDIHKRCFRDPGRPLVSLRTEFNFAHKLTGETCVSTKPNANFPNRTCESRVITFRVSSIAFQAISLGLGYPFPRTSPSPTSTPAPSAPLQTRVRVVSTVLDNAEALACSYRR